MSDDLNLVSNLMKKGYLKGLRSTTRESYHGGRGWGALAALLYDVGCTVYMLLLLYY